MNRHTKSQKLADKLPNPHTSGTGRHTNYRDGMTEMFEEGYASVANTKGKIEHGISEEQRKQGKLIVGGMALGGVLLCGAVIFGPAVVESAKQSFEVLNPIAQEGLKIGLAGLAGGVIGAVGSEDGSIKGRVGGFVSGAMKGAGLATTIELGRGAYELYQDSGDGMQIFMRAAGRAIVGGIGGAKINKKNPVKGAALGALTGVAVPPIAVELLM